MPDYQDTELRVAERASKALRREKTSSYRFSRSVYARSTRRPQRIGRESESQGRLISLKRTDD